MNIFALCLAVLTAVFALSTISKEKAPLFYKIVACGSFCYLLAVTYRVLYAMLIPYPSFHAGYLGYAGTYFFMLSAYFSEPKDIIHTKSKISLISLLPALVITVWGFWNVYGGYGILPQLLLIPVIPTCYYSCKCLLLPKDETGFVSAMRLYNASVLLLSLVQPIVIIAMVTRVNTNLPIFVTSVLTTVSTILAYRGCRKWCM